jgi:CRISPR-associated protein Cst2
LKNERELMVKYEEYPNPTKWADDKLFGFLAVNKRKEIEDAEAALKKAGEDLKKTKDDAERAKLQGKLGELESKLAKLREYPAFQGDSILRVNYAVSLDPFKHNSTMHQSPMITGAFSNADSSAIIQREVHVTAYQYPFGLNLNDLSLGAVEGDNGEQTKLWRKWTAVLLRAIGELNGVAGNHARTMYPFAPVSIILRLTARRTPDFDLYGYGSNPQESQRELLEGLKSGRLPGDEFYLGGRIVRENQELNQLLNSNQGEQAAPDAQAGSEEKGGIKAIKIFASPVEAIEALIKDAGLNE